MLVFNVIVHHAWSQQTCHMGGNQEVVTTAVLCCSVLCCAVLLQVPKRLSAACCKLMDCCDMLGHILAVSAWVALLTTAGRCPALRGTNKNLSSSSSSIQGSMLQQLEQGELLQRLPQLLAQAAEMLQTARPELQTIEQLLEDVRSGAGPSTPSDSTQETPSSSLVTHTSSYCCSPACGSCGDRAMTAGQGPGRPLLRQCSSSWQQCSMSADALSYCQQGIPS
jgi:hypothetical protein